MIKTEKKQPTFNTTAVHAGHTRRDAYGAHLTPIYQTSTFVFEDVDQGSKAFHGENDSHIYSRLGNPTVEELERAICDLETYGMPDAEDFMGMAFGSGMAAMTTGIIAFGRGGHIIAQEALYGCTSQFLSHEAPELGMTTSFVDTTDLFLIELELEKHPDTKLIYLESIANPTMSMCDIRAISDLAEKYGAFVMVDNTFATPYHLQPLTMGAHIVAHSTTKYLGGHGSVIGGALVVRKSDNEASHLFKFRKNLGGIAAPMDAFLLSNGIKTLSVRMEKHARNALTVARFLEAHPAVDRVWFPGLQSHPQHKLATHTLKRGFGGVMTFELSGGFEKGKALMNSVELCTLAVSLGTVDTLIQHPASMTHSVMDDDIRQRAGISDGLVRLAVGIEDAEDIIYDLEQALSRI